MAGFKKRNPGACRCCTVTTATFCPVVAGQCGGIAASIPNCPVTVFASNGTTVLATTTTNSSGVCPCVTIAAPQSGGVVVKAFPPAVSHYGTGTLTYSTFIAAGSTKGPDGTTTVTCGPASGYSCTETKCCVSDSNYNVGPPYPVWTPPTTLFVADGFGTVSCTKVVGQVRWLGCAARTAAQGYASACSGLAQSNVSIQVTFQVDCSGIGNGWSDWTVTSGSPLCNTFFPLNTTCPVAGSGYAASGAPGSGSFTGTCDAIAMTATQNFTSSDPGFQIYGASSTLSVTE